MSSKGGSAKGLTRDEFYDVMPDWSPDSQLIAFSSNRDGPLQIYLMFRNGTGLKLLTRMPGETSEVDWRPAPFDGQ
jgi:Tol biopolymer transport system component